MTALKLHYDGWLKLPASSLRTLGAKTGDTLDITPHTHGGLVLRTRANSTSPKPKLPDPSTTARAVEDAPQAAAKPSRRVRVSSQAKASVALPPALRGAGRRKPRTAASSGDATDDATTPSSTDRRANPA